MQSRLKLMHAQMLSQPKKHRVVLDDIDFVGTTMVPVKIDPMIDVAITNPLPLLSPISKSASGSNSDMVIACFCVLATHVISPAFVFRVIIMSVTFVNLELLLHEYNFKMTKYMLLLSLSVTNVSSAYI